MDVQIPKEVNNVSNSQSHEADLRNSGKKEKSYCVRPNIFPVEAARKHQEKEKWYPFENNYDKSSKSEDIGLDKSFGSKINNKTIY